MIPGSRSPLTKTRWKRQCKNMLKGWSELIWKRLVLSNIFWVTYGTFPQIVCPGNDRERHLFIVSCEPLVRVALGAINFSVLFGYVCLHAKCISTNARCCDGREDPGSKQQMWSMDSGFNSVSAMWFEACTEPLAAAMAGTTGRPKWACQVVIRGI